MQLQLASHHFQISARVISALLFHHRTFPHVYHSSLGTFRQIDVSAQEHMDMGTFWHGEFSERAIYGTETFWHFGKWTFQLKSRSAEMSILPCKKCLWCWKFLDPKHSRAKKSMCQKVHGYEMLMCRYNVCKAKKLNMQNVPVMKCLCWNIRGRIKAKPKSTCYQLSSLLLRNWSHSSGGAFLQTLTGTYT